VVINELMYHPITENDDDQYIELFNRSGSPVNLSGWTLGDGVSFTFPDRNHDRRQRLPGCRQFPRQLSGELPHRESDIVLGDFGGNLSGSGERVTLGMLDSIVSTNGACARHELLPDRHGRSDVRQTVDAGDNGRMVAAAVWNGLIHVPISRLPSNWADSDETAKAPWKLVTATGTIDNGNVRQISCRSCCKAQANA
jgi:hypothetical protein